MSAISCFAINIVTEFSLTVISFVVFLGCCSSANIVMAVAVNLFPTKYRGMATSFILMFGRIGGFSGSNIVGLLLANMCTSIFYLNGALLISKSICWRQKSPYTCETIFDIKNVSISGCFFLFIMIRTKEKSTSIPETPAETKWLLENDHSGRYQ